MLTYFRKGLTKWSNTQGVDINCYSYTGLLLSFESHAVVLFSIPVKKLLLCEWILSTKGNFIHSIEEKQAYSAIRSVNGLRPLMTPLVHVNVTRNIKHWLQENHRLHVVQCVGFYLWIILVSLFSFVQYTCTCLYLEISQE